GANVDLAVLDEVVGTATVEGLFHVGHEEVFAETAGSAGQVGTLGEDLVQLLPVVSGDVLYVADILVAAFDLEGAHAGLDQVHQVVGLVVVLQRQQVLVVSDDTALIILQGVRQATGLRTVAAV